jgi:predicted DNA-binding ribbon-helix-helix protein
MAHLQAQATRKDEQQRKGVKFTLAKRLYESGYQRQDVINLFRFIDWTIISPKTLDQEFWQELRELEEQQNMPYITSVEQIGIEKGERIGIEKGKRSLILHLLTRRVGEEVPAALSAQIEALPLDQLEALGEALLDFTSFTDLQAWLSQ